MNNWQKFSRNHGGALVDFGSDFTRRSFAFQSGQIYSCAPVAVTPDRRLSPIRYLATASRFFNKR
jgi:hypothetical protein